MTNQVEVLYFAMLQESARKNHEVISLDPGLTASKLYQKLKSTYDFSLEFHQLRVAINDRFAPGESVLKEGDRVAYIPPVSGG
jgi:molybdopterin synthase sulfur carrier subunit